MSLFLVDGVIQVLTLEPEHVRVVVGDLTDVDETVKVQVTKTLSEDPDGFVELGSRTRGEVLHVNVRDDQVELGMVVTTLGWGALSTPHRETPASEEPPTRLKTVVTPVTPEVLELILTECPSQGPVLTKVVRHVRQGVPVVPEPLRPIGHQTDGHPVVLLPPTLPPRVLGGSVRLPTLAVVARGPVRLLPSVEGPDTPSRRPPRPRLRRWVTQVGTPNIDVLPSITLPLHVVVAPVRPAPPTTTPVGQAPGVATVDEAPLVVRLVVPLVQPLGVLPVVGVVTDESGQDGEFPARVPPGVAHGASVLPGPPLSCRLGLLSVGLATPRPVPPAPGVPGTPLSPRRPQEGPVGRLVQTCGGPTHVAVGLLLLRRRVG